MNIAVKAALYNALLFPGWGHFYLKKYKRGTIFILPVLAGMLWICWAVIQVALDILKANPFKKGTADITAIAGLAINSAKEINLTHFSLIVLLMILLWIISIIDSYRLGKKQIQKNIEETET
jgi:hypothetical protein